MRKHVKNIVKTTGCVALLSAASMAYAAAPHLAGNKPIMMGYYADWNIYGGKDNYFPGANNPNDPSGPKIANQDLSDKLAKLNTITYAFLEANTTGSVYFFDTWADLNANDASFCSAHSAICNGRTTSAYLGYGDFDAMANSDVTNKFISIGGFGHTDTWTNAFANPQTFANSIVTVIKQFPGINGVDLDAEPLSAINPTDMVNLVKTLRTALNAAGLNEVVISLPLAANPGEITGFGKANWTALMQNLSYVGLMGYDLHGEFDQPAITALQSSLYSTKQDTQHFDDNDAVNALVSMGVPKSDIILGVPTYARTVGGVTSPGLGQTFTQSYAGDLDTAGCTVTLGQGNTCGGMESNRALYSTFITNPDQINNVVQDNVITGAYINSGTDFFSFDSYQSAAAKGQYVRSNGLAGALVWDLYSAVPVAANSPTANESAINGLYSTLG